MLIVRRSVFAAFAAAATARIAVKLSEELGLERVALEQFLLRLRAAHGIEGEDDARRMAVIARELGFDFDERPEHAWMADMLHDPAVTSISRRVIRLSEERSRRVMVAAHNAAVERGLRGRRTRR